MDMDLTPKTKIMALIKEYDFMLDFLVEYSPEFKKLKNPVLRNTVGRMATLELAASMAKVPLDKLIQDIRAVIEERTGRTVSVNTESGPPLDEAKVESLKKIIRELHEGADVEQVKGRFAELVRDVSPTEISAMEQQLMDEGLPQEEIKRLCDVHVQVFKEALDRQERVETPPGHPVHTYQAENRALEQEAKALRSHLETFGEPPTKQAVEGARQGIEKTLERLSTVETHYVRKENQLFPFLERHGVTGPSQVMWAIHDDVRALVKETRAALQSTDAVTLTTKGKELVQVVVDMIYKEENILFPMSLQLLSEGDWAEVRQGEAEIGYALVEPGDKWQPSAAPDEQPVPGTAAVLEALPLDTGLLSLEQVNLLLRTLPVDLSLVDEHDTVRYYSDTTHRIFPRSPGVIGRKVRNCHPQKSVHMVDRILEAFRAGDKDVAEFWITLNGRFLHIRYFALRDVGGRYRGCLEVGQDVTDIRALDGERRLLDWGE
jgi:DUF438 domain-containing protein